MVNYDESQVSDVLVEGESIGRVAPHIEVQPLFPVSNIQPLGRMVQTSHHSSKDISENPPGLKTFVEVASGHSDFYVYPRCCAVDGAEHVSMVQR